MNELLDFIKTLGVNGKDGCKLALLVLEVVPIAHIYKCDISVHHKTSRRQHTIFFFSKCRLLTRNFWSTSELSFQNEKLRCNVCELDFIHK